MVETLMGVGISLGVAVALSLSICGASLLLRRLING